MVKNKNLNETSSVVRKQQKARELKEQKKANRKLRWQQFWQAFKLQRQEDKWLLPSLLLVFLGTWLVIGLLFKVFLHAMWPGIIFGLLLGIIISLIFFGKRVQKNVYKKAAGNLGAAGWVLENMRGKWYAYNSIAGNANFDLVHMTIGKPGVILVGEGPTSKVHTLLGQEKKRIARIVGTTPIYTITVGDGEKDIPLPKLEAYLNKLPKNINNATISALHNRISSLHKTNVAIPKGPLPSQAMRGKSMQRVTNRKQHK